MLYPVFSIHALKQCCFPSMSQCIGICHFDTLIPASSRRTPNIIPILKLCQANEIELIRAIFIISNCQIVHLMFLEEILFVYPLLASIKNDITASPLVEFMAFLKSWYVDWYVTICIYNERIYIYKYILFVLLCGYQEIA